MNEQSDEQWRLMDVEDSHRKSPSTFHLAPLAERESLKEGTLARLVFMPRKSDRFRAERMWVRVSQVTAGRYIGELVNDPLTISGLLRGAEIAFEPRHIATILVTRDDKRWIDERKHAYVSKRVLEYKCPICFLYREAPDTAEDSGWRIFAGDEPEDYVNNPENIRLCSLQSVLNTDETLESILNEAIPAAFERDGYGSPFRKVEDFGFGKD